MVNSMWDLLMYKTLKTEQLLILSIHIGFGCNATRIQMMEVVIIARMVPTGIDFWASRRSPDRFEPAIIPEWLLTGNADQICIIMASP